MPLPTGNYRTIPIQSQMDMVRLHKDVTPPNALTYLEDKLAMILWFKGGGDKYGYAGAIQALDDVRMPINIYLGLNGSLGKDLDDNYVLKLKQLVEEMTKEMKMSEKGPVEKKLSSS
jgi:hypothetical protein